MASSKELLEMYREMWEEKRGSGVKHSPEEWDRRAPGWGVKESKPRRANRRVEEAVRLFESHGILGPDCDVIDIGCGPGLFVEAFAEKAHHVTGTDFSPKMLEYAEEYCAEHGALNTSFVVADFKSASVAELGWEKQFDLVFASMTPAINQIACIEKMMAISRGWCCNTTCISSTGKLQNGLTDLFGADIVHNAWNGKWFHFLNSIVYLMGYFPETTYYEVEHVKEWEVTFPKVEDELRKLCRDKTPGPEGIKKAYEMLLAKSEDGVYRDEYHNWYGTVLWDVRKSIDRSWEDGKIT